MIAQLQDCTAHAHGFVRYGEMRMRLVWLRQADARFLATRDDRPTRAGRVYALGL